MAEPDKSRIRQYLKWTDALMRAMDAAVRVDDPHGLWKHAGFRQFARKYTDLVTLISKEMPLPPLLDIYNVAAIPGPADTVPFQRREIFDEVYANLSLLKGILENQLGVIENETEALRDFFQARLRSAVLHEPERAGCPGCSRNTPGWPRPSERGRLRSRSRPREGLVQRGCPRLHSA